MFWLISDLATVVSQMGNRPVRGVRLCLQHLLATRLLLGDRRD